jgi:hypothetical protein
MDADEMKKQVVDGFKGMGVDFKFDADHDLDGYRRGEPLSMGALRSMKTGDVVWLYIYYKESVRADGAYRLEVLDDGGWMFDDGSSFGADFYCDEPDEAPAEDEWTTLYRAVKKA